MEMVSNVVVFINSIDFFLAVGYLTFFVLSLLVPIRIQLFIKQWVLSIVRKNKGAKKEYHQKIERGVQEAAF